MAIAILSCVAVSAFAKILSTLAFLSSALKPAIN